MVRIETFEAVCPDGWRLRGDWVIPETPRAVCVIGHAMMVNRRCLDRPSGQGLVSQLVAHGVAVLWIDLRGHGDSGPGAHQGANWSYDDLVADVPVLFAAAHARFPGLRLGALGHSMFGHVVLAYLGRQPEIPLDALVCLACNVANPSWARRPVQYAMKRVTATLSAALARRVGRLPVRRFGVGPADEARTYTEEMAHWGQTLDWRARDGWSYFEALSAIRTPVLAIAGTGDRFYAPPADVRDLMRHVPKAQFHEVGRKSGLAFDPGHMDLVVDPRCRPAWDLAADFLR